MYKQIKLFLLFSVLAIGANAQKLSWGKLTQPSKRYSIAAAADNVPLTQNIYGPVANVASYALTDNSLLIGAGFGYKHMRWAEVTSEWKEIWSVNLLAWYKNSLDKKSDAFAYGAAAGFTLGSFLGKGLVGFGTTNLTDISKYFPTAGITWPINR